MALICDTGPLYAAMDIADQDHVACARLLETTDEQVLDWLLKAGTALASHLKLAGWWRAAIYSG